MNWRNTCMRSKLNLGLGYIINTWSLKKLRQRRKASQLKLVQKGLWLGLAGSVKHANGAMGPRRWGIVGHVGRGQEEKRLKKRMFFMHPNHQEHIHVLPNSSSIKLSLILPSSTHLGNSFCANTSNNAHVMMLQTNSFSLTPDYWLRNNLIWNAMYLYLIHLIGTSFKNILNEVESMAAPDLRLYFRS